jgi:hypothetical protein
MWARLIKSVQIGEICLSAKENNDGVFITLSDGKEDGKYFVLDLTKNSADAIVDILNAIACAALEPPRENNFVIYEESVR